MQHQQRKQQQYTQQQIMVALANKEPSHQLLYPVINKEAFNKTIINYRFFVHHFNKKKLPILNANVDKYNAKVNAFNIARKFTKEQLKAAKNDFKIHLRSNYTRGTKSTRDINGIIEHYNHGRQIKIEKEHFVTIKYQTIEVFSSILGHACFSLKLRNLNRLNYRQETVLNPSKGFTFSITPKKLLKEKITIKELEIDVPKLDVCATTIRNAVRRLMDSNIISDNTFRGYKIATEIVINPEVLVILEGRKTLDKTTAKSSLEKDLAVNTIGSYSNLSQLKNNKANSAKADSPTQQELEALEHVRGIFAGSASNSAPDSKSNQFYRNDTPQATAKKLEQKKVAPKKENEAKPLLKSMQKLLDMEVYDAAKQLANGEMDYYTPLSIRDIKREAAIGAISREQFRKIIVFDFLFTSAKLWREDKYNVWIGTWLNTYKLINSQYFLLSFNGEKYTPQKATIIKHLEQYRWRINWAYRYCERNKVKAKEQGLKEFNLLFPVKYFNKTRKKSYEGGFGYTRKYLLKSINAKKKRIEDKKTDLKDANKRDIKHKILQYVRRYLYKGVSFERLVSYIRSLEKKHNRTPHYYSALFFETLETEKRKKQFN